MKLLTIFFCISFSTALFSAQAEVEAPLIVIHGEVTADLESLQTASVNVFLSYVGLRFNHCGIKLETSTQDAPEVQDFLMENVVIHDQAGNEIAERDSDGDLVAVVANPHIDRYGRFHIVSTRRGETLAQLTARVKETFQHDLAIRVKNLSCLR
jgi:hypothetical protein